MLRLTIAKYFLHFGSEVNEWLLETEECPGFGPEVDAVEAGERNAVAVQFNGAAQTCATGRQGHGESVELQARHFCQHPLPVTVMPHVTPNSHINAQHCKTITLTERTGLSREKWVYIA